MGVGREALACDGGLCSLWGKSIRVEVAEVIGYPLEQAMRILYIDIDTTRPDHFGCYGYHRNTSPAIDAIAKEGIRFTNYYTPDAPCLPSRAAMYTGRFGIQTGLVGHGGTSGDHKLEGAGRGFRGMYEDDAVVRQLQKMGYHTVCMSPFGQRHGSMWFYAGFGEIHNTGQGGMESAETVMPIAVDWFDRNAGKDKWFVHLNLWDPHTPYRVPADFGDPFKDDPLPEWLDDDELIKKHNKMAGPHTSLDIAMYDDGENPRFPRAPGKVTDKASMRRLIDGYDTGIRYADEQVARIVAILKEQGVYDDTAIIVSSDHGENFGELGIYAEHGTADNITCRIPMIIKWPGGAKGAVVNGLHYNLDWGPTLMDLLCGQKPAKWQGQSYSQTVLTGKEKGREQLVLSQCAHVCQRSVRWDKWLYMRTYHDGFHLFPKEMLFDVVADPHEQHDLAEKHPEVCREGAARLANWHDEQMQTMAVDGPDVADPLWTVYREGGPFHARHAAPSPLPKYLKRLEETGRADKAQLLREKYAKWL